MEKSVDCAFLKFLIDNYFKKNFTGISAWENKKVA